MACNLFPNGVCGGCINFVKSTNVTLNGDTLVIEIPNEELTNGLQRCICIAQDIPTYTAIPNISIKVGLNTYEIVHSCSCGLQGVPNKLYANQLRQNNGKMASRQILKVRYALDTQFFGYCGYSPLCISNVICPQPEPTPPEPTESKVKKGGK